jgi:cytochrome c55X
MKRQRLRWPELLAAFFIASTPALAGDVTRMRQAQLIDLVRQDCGSCHGMSLKGGLGRPLRPSDLSGLDESSLADIILDGVPGTPMPPWRGLLSETEARWIAHSLKTGLEK